MSERRGQTSASNAQADALCHGRHLAQVGLPEPERNGDADWGTAIHAVLAKLTHPASVEVLHKLPEFGLLDPTQQEIAESCVSIELQKLAEFFGADWPKSKVFREQRYWVKISPAISHSGRVDVIYRLGNRGLLSDYKSLGADKPENPENLQLRDLVCLSAGNLYLDEIGCFLNQPLATHSPTPCLYEKEDIQRATQEMFARVLKSNDAAAPRTPGELQCAFCLARGKCPEYQLWAGSQLPVPKSLVEVPVTQWTPEQRRQFCDAYDVAADWLEFAWNAMKAGAERDPNFVPGYALVPNSPQRPITDPQQLFERLCQLGDSNILLPQFMGCVAVTKSKVTELLATLTKLKGKALAKKAEQLFSGITGEIPKQPSLKKAV